MCGLAPVHDMLLCSAHLARRYLPDKALADAALRERLTAQGSVMLGGTQKQYVDYLKAEGARWSAVVRETGANAE